MGSSQRSLSGFALGDRLYVDVWDNKDPLVYYSIALARTFGPLGAWILEVAWVALASAPRRCSSPGRSSLTRRLSVWVGMVLGPFVILGYLYFMGTTHLPGIALIMTALALAAWDRPVLAGVSVGLVLFVKLIMGPLAIVLAVALIVLSGRRRALKWFCAGLGALVVAFIGLMAFRGELVEFVRTQVLNTTYSQAPIVSPTQTGLMQKIAQHVVILVNPHVFVILLTSAVLVLSLGWRHRTLPRSARWPQLPMLAWLIAVAVVMEIVTIFLTGKWLPHAEIFAVSSAARPRARHWGVEHRAAVRNDGDGPGDPCHRCAAGRGSFADHLPGRDEGAGRRTGGGAGN